MGIVGSILAWHLLNAGRSFTWHDIDAKVRAWTASTGAIYPSGDVFDAMNYEVWSDWCHGEAPWERFIGRHYETSGWWYCTKSAPHGAKGKPVARFGMLHRGPAPSMHFNAQSFVPATRAYFQKMRREGTPSGARKVITHGFSQRLDHYVWGWTRKVKLDWTALRPYERHERAAVYLRRGRFVMAYAYPIPGEPWWYAGSNLIVQKKARSLVIPPKYETWKRNFEELSGGAVRIVEEGPFIEGWRPAGADLDGDLVREMDGALVLKPFWNSGIRHSPLTMRAAMDALGGAR